MDRLVEYFENSFLEPLLRKESVNDISYNGVDLFYEDKNLGRKKSNIIVTKQDVYDFLRQIANLSEKQFSMQTPVLDVSFGKYRLNAEFSSIVKVGETSSYSFSIRICNSSSSLDKSFFGGISKKLLLNAIKNNESIVISGSTSSGKTQLQKYLITQMKDSSRVIVIDNVKELELIRGKSSIDLTTWQADENNSSISFSSLIKNALRNNPDYIVVAESRGGEMLQVLNSVMSGHPIITTIHAKDLEAIPHRMARMTMMGSEKQLFDDALADIYHHFSLIVYLEKQYRKNGSINRFVSSIGKLNEETKSIDILYERKKK